MLKGYEVMRGGRLALGLNRKGNYKSINIDWNVFLLYCYVEKKKGKSLKSERRQLLYTSEIRHIEGSSIS
jgi:hypothetical protein